MEKKKIASVEIVNEEVYNYLVKDLTNDELKEFIEDCEECINDGRCVELFQLLYFEESGVSYSDYLDRYEGTTENMVENLRDCYSDAVKNLPIFIQEVIDWKLAVKEWQRYDCCAVEYRGEQYWFNNNY